MTVSGARSAQGKSTPSAARPLRGRGTPRRAPGRCARPAPGRARRRPCAARRRWPGRRRPPTPRPRARASRSAAMKRSTALTDVSTTQRWSRTSAAAARSAAPPSAGSTWRVSGSSRALGPRPFEARRPGPRPAAPRASPPPCARPAGPSTAAGRRAERGHRTDDDDGGRAQLDLGQAAQRGAHHPLGGRRAAGDDRDRRVGRPARRATSASAMAARVVMPMRITSVPPTRASASQSGPPAPAASPTRPVTTVTDEARPRWVTGMPTAAGTPKADVTPGTTSQGMPGLGQHLDLLAAPAEEEGVAPLEAHHDRGLPPVLDEQAVDLVLAPAASVGRVGVLADVDQPRRRRRQVEDGAARRGGRAARRRPGPAVAAPRRVRSPGSPGPAPTR